MFETVYLPIIISFLSLGFVWYLISSIQKEDMGTEKMKEIYQAIKDGSNAFLKRQYKAIGIMSVIMVFIFLFVYNFSEAGIAIAISFGVGALCSAIAGLIGMWIAVRTNIRTAAAAQTSFSKALKIALNGGAVSGIAITALSLLGICFLYAYYTHMGKLDTEIPQLIAGFGFGASLVALFAQLGGGIYTKAADVGADLVGKIEQGIPEDDPRNPAVIADLVGDNVGDCAGRGADLFESTAAENIGTMILGVALVPQFGLAGIFFPLIVRSFGMLASIVGIISVKAKEDEHPLAALNRGYFITSILSTIAFYFITMEMLGNIMFFWAGLLGIIASIGFVFATQYYTESKYRPIKDIVKASETGHGTNIISGIAVGYESTGVSVLIIITSLWGSYQLGELAFLGGGFYGTAAATMGMLSTAAYILAMDTFGPITDNAGGIVEMSGCDAKVRERTDKLDTAGNTTKALTKGYAMGSAALAAFLLFEAYIKEAIHFGKMTEMVVNFATVEVFIGGFIGAALIFFFSALAMKAVGKAAGDIVEEVRRQFKERPGIMEGTEKPDYAKCVDITTQAALKQMILPGALAVFVPILVGVVMGAEVVAALIMVGTITGVLLATVMNNAGGAWDNAKKYFETEGKKGTPAHMAAVTGDTVGDPFKDTAGPSLHVLVKLLGTLSLALVALF